MNTIAIASFLLAIISVGVAIYQGFERKRLDLFVKNQAWHNYSLILRAWGIQQSSFNKYKDIYGKDVDLELLEQLSKTDTFLHALHLESIRQIQLSESNFDIQLVNLWQYIGRISESQAKAFKETATFNPPGIIGSIKIHLHRYLQEKISHYQTELTKPKEERKI